MANSSSSPGSGFFRTGPRRWIVLAVVVVVLLAIILSMTLAPRASRNRTLPATTTSAAPRTAPTATASADSTTPSPTSSPPVGPVPRAAPRALSSAIPRAAPPVPIDASPAVAPEIDVHVTTLKAVQGEAKGPGDVAGPSVQVTLQLKNGTAKPADLSTAVVNMYYGPGYTPASPLPGPGGSPLPATVGAGKTVAAVYVFSIPKSERRNVTITFDYSVKHPVVVLQGSAPS